MTSYAFLLPLCLALGSPSDEPSPDTAVVSNCLLSLADEVQIPAQENGVLTKLAVKEGQSVSVGDFLAQIDDEQPRVAAEVADAKLRVAEKEATDDINIRYARAAANTAKVSYEKGIAANAKIEGVVPEMEILERKLKWTEMLLSIQKAQKEMDVAKLQVAVSKAELHAADVNTRRRRITAPLNGVVVELSRHENEWVQNGDPVLRIVRVDLLRVDGFLRATEYSQLEIREGQPVQVAVSMPHQQREIFTGKVVYVKPIVEGGNFLVRAEVENRRQNGVWVLSPGLLAEMTIRLKQGPAEK
jgi:multidrug efflux pump subunit AcrA (membrane-fusion protein)